MNQAPLIWPAPGITPTCYTVTVTIEPLSEIIQQTNNNDLRFLFSCTIERSNFIRDWLDHCGAKQIEKYMEDGDVPQGHGWIEFGPEDRDKAMLFKLTFCQDRRLIQMRDLERLRQNAIQTLEANFQYLAGMYYASVDESGYGSGRTIDLSQRATDCMLMIDCLRDGADPRKILFDKVSG